MIPRGDYNQLLTFGGEYRNDKLEDGTPAAKVISKFGKSVAKGFEA